MGKEKLEEQLNDVVVMIDTLFYSVKSTFSAFYLRNSEFLRKMRCFRFYFSFI